MLKIGITQRVDNIESINEIRDSLDQGWTKLFEENGFVLIPIPNMCSVQHFIESIGIDGIIISGGNDDNSREKCETACINYCINNALPLFGVCHGMQFIGQYFGSKLVSVQNHVGHLHEIIVHNNIYGINCGKFLVNSFHRFVLNEVPNYFAILATDNEGNCEAMYHCSLPIVAFMWHPERPPCLKWFNTFIKNFYAKC